MPQVGEIAFAIFGIVTTIVAYAASSLRAKLQNRAPCRKWFAFAMGVLAVVGVFSFWVGNYGLGAAEPGPKGAAFGVFAGLVWGGIFSGINVTILWRAFDSPNRDDDAEQEKIMNEDLKVLFAQIWEKVRSFRPTPGFARAGLISWSLFLAAVALPAFWAYAFCFLTWLTEGAPGVQPAMPIEN